MIEEAIKSLTEAVNKNTEAIQSILASMGQMPAITVAPGGVLPTETPEPTPPPEPKAEKKKAEKKAELVKVTEPAPTPAPAPVAPSPAPTGPTLAQIMELANKLVDAQQLDPIKAVNTKFGLKRIREAQEKDFAAIHADLQKAVDALNSGV